MKQKHSHFLIPGILLLGIVLRAPFTTLSTVLSDIASGLGVEVSSLGLLTSLPLLTFAIFSPFAASWAKRFGIERLFLGVLIVMTIGSALRTVNLPLDSSDTALAHDIPDSVLREALATASALELVDMHTIFFITRNIH